MAKNNKKIQKEIHDNNIREDIKAIIILAIGIFLFLTVNLNIAGSVGAFIHDALRGTFGVVAVLISIIFIIISLLLFTKKLISCNYKTIIFSILIFINLCMLNSIRFINSDEVNITTDYIHDYYESGIIGDSGGVLGMELSGIFIKLIGKAGLILLTLTILIISFILIANKTFPDILSKASFKESRTSNERRFSKILSKIKKDDNDEIINLTNSDEIILPTDENQYEDYREKEKLSIKQQKIIGYVEDDFSIGKDEDLELKKDEIEDEPIINDRDVSYGLDGYVDIPKSYGLDGMGKPKKEDKNSRKKSEVLDDEDNIEKEIENLNSDIKSDIKYKLPSINLLKRSKSNSRGMTSRQLRDSAEKLEDTLRNFGVDAGIVQVIQGSSVTRYEIQPALGVKVNSIVKLHDDLALNMRAKSLRIEAPIPGKAAVGIEIENEQPSPVTIRELIDSDEFKNAESKISFVVGKDVSGKNIVANLKDMPHMLVAGATGSGKSVFINSIIMSILYKAKPDEVKLIMVDPKVVELSNYNGIPHMLIPVVTDPKKAAAALNWAVNEMDKRYNKFAECRVRDLKSFNKHIEKNNLEETKLPQIVIIIDEFADLMMTASAQVETAVARLAQKGRAAGMHIIIATQRPSVDVITGVIKANIPSRVALMVSSQVDSRTILDSSGAEQLIGNGDMLFKPGDYNSAIRVQSPYVSDEEIFRIIEFVKNQESANYNEEAIEKIETPEKASSNDSEDELTGEAIDFILNKKTASVSMLQRRFRIGYNRAARIIDEIEEMGIIGPQDGSRGREVLISREDYYGDDYAEDESEKINE